MSVYRNWVYPNGYPAKIEATNEFDFKNRCFWKDESNEYYNAIYTFISSSRPQFAVQRDVVVNNFGDENVIFQSKIQKYRFDFIVNSCFVDFWSTLSMHSIIRVTHLRANQTVFLKNLTFTDNTQGVDQGTITIVGDLATVVDRQCRDDVINTGCI